MFLSIDRLPERGTGRPDAVSSCRTKLPRTRREFITLSYGCSFRRRDTVSSAVTPEKLPSPSGRGTGAFTAPSRRPPFSSWTYRLAYLAPANRCEDDVGLSSVNVVSHCVPVTPPVTLMAREPYPNTGPRRGDRSPEASAGLGAWPAILAETRRLQNYPRLAPSTPAVTLRRWLRTLSEERFERRFPNEFGLAQVGFDFIRSSQ